MEDFEKFYKKALRFLSFRPRSEKEVRDRLKIKNQKSRLRQGFGGQAKIKNLELVINQVIQKLKEQNFVNDEEFTKWWIESRTTFKLRSLRLIKLELRQKGVSNEIIDKTIYDLRFKNYDLEQAKKLIEKRIGRFRNKPVLSKAEGFGMTREEVYQKLESYLARRGFDWETIKQAIDEVLFKRV